MLAGWVAFAVATLLFSGVSLPVGAALAIAGAGMLLGLASLPRPGAQAMPHPPPRRSQHLQALKRRNKERDAIIPHHTHTFCKPVKGVKLESGKIKSLKLRCRISHGGF